MQLNLSNKPINERIKEWIRSKGFTFKFISIKSGIPYQRLYRILNTEQPVTVNDLLLISKAAGASITEFFKDNPEDRL